MCTHVCCDICMVAGEMGYFWHNRNANKCYQRNILTSRFRLLLWLFLCDCCFVCLLPYWTKSFSFIFAILLKCKTTTSIKSMTVPSDREHKSIDYPWFRVCLFTLNAVVVIASVCKFLFVLNFFTYKIARDSIYNKFWCVIIIESLKPSIDVCVILQTIVWCQRIF